MISEDAVIAIRSPDILPAPSRFIGLHRCPTILLVDTLPLQRRSPMTRTRLGGEGYLTLPVVGGAHGLPPAHTVRLLDGRRWRRKWMTRLDHECAGLVYHDVIRDDVAQLLETSEGLMDLNVGLWTLLLRGLRIRSRLVRISEVLAEESSSERPPDAPGRASRASTLAMDLTRAATRLGARELRLAPGDRPPAGLHEACAARDRVWSRPPEDLRPDAAPTAYHLIARWGAMAGHHIPGTPSPGECGDGPR